MLSAILSKSDCANCKFCCSFRRQSLWETPIFTKSNLEEIKKLFPNVKFKTISTCTGAAFTFDISDKYLTNDSKEEVPCPFLDSKKGCILPPELKPFDCKIWPLRVVSKQKTENLEIALTPTCPAINKVPFEKVCQTVNESLREKIISYANENPAIIKEKTEFLSNIIPKK